MSIRKVNLAPGEYFHIYNRGNSKQRIFNNKNDYSRFMQILFLANFDKSFKYRDMAQNIYSTQPRGRKLVHIGAYCLMPNHFHLLVKSIDEVSTSKFIQKLSTAYSMYFNLKYKRIGGLFEGKFRSEHLSSDRYLKYMFSYIHLNPIKLIDREWKEKGIRNKSKTFNFLQSYEYSSYLDFIHSKSNRPEKVILNKKEFPRYFLSDKLFLEEMLNWVIYNKSI